MNKNLVLLLVLSSCGSTNSISPEVENFINSQNFTVVKPNNWRPVKEHGSVSYTPIKTGDNIFKNLVSIFQYSLKEKPPFKTFYQDQIKRTNEVIKINHQEITNAKSRFGDSVIHKFESTLGGKAYIRFTIYFERNGEYYNYNYSSFADKYEKYYEAAISIFQSIKFK